MSTSKLLISVLLLAALAAVVTIYYAPQVVSVRIVAVTNALQVFVVFVVVMGFYISAAEAGAQARKTAATSGEEARKTALFVQERVDRCHIGLLRAHFIRLWVAIDEPLGIKRYHAAAIEQVLRSIEDAYWKSETFGAFDVTNQALVQDAINVVRANNFIAADMCLTKTQPSHWIVRQAFVTSIEALESVFTEVFSDEKIVALIRDRKAKNNRALELYEATEERRLDREIKEIEAGLDINSDDYESEG